MTAHAQGLTSKEATLASLREHPNLMLEVMEAAICEYKPVLSWNLTGTTSAGLILAQCQWQCASQSVGSVSALATLPRPEIPKEQREIELN